ncbi:transcriptional activator [Diplocarpon rosae]|nr:transcriptional activator [Diplocarpon rosae]
MSANDSFEMQGLVVPGPDEQLDPMGTLSYAVLDDTFYNILHDLVFETFREEKMLRASSAAILVEQKASQVAEDDESADFHETKIIETEGASWENGIAYLKGNPLQTTKEIRCLKCGLLRLLHPTDGNGGRKPEPGVQYCTKHPFINKPYHDVYGQTYVPEGPGRGKKKKDMINPLKQQKENTPNGSQDSPNTTPPPGEEEEKVPISYPSSKCNNCGVHVPIKRMNNHMAKCIGGFGRQSSRDAKTKMANGNGAGNQGGYTPPPGSRNSTPVPPSKNGRTSPNKRDADEDFENEESPHKKKKPLKKSPANKLKIPKISKNSSQHSASGLSFESKPPASDDEDDGDDDRDGDFNEKSIFVEPKKKKTLKPIKKLTKPKSKWLYGSGAGAAVNPPPGVPPDPLKLKIRTSTGGELNGHSKGQAREKSESSQTLSSPN